MNIVLILIPITLLLVTAGILIFNWAVKSGQYDDLEGPAHRILYDDDQDMIPDDAQRPRKAGHPVGEQNHDGVRDDNEPGNPKA